MKETNIPSFLPPLKEPQKGYKWVYRGSGWKIDKEVDYAYMAPSEDSEWNYAIASKASGFEDYHYFELVKSFDTLEDQIELAKSMVGKRFTKDGVTQEVLSWHITNFNNTLHHSVLVCNEVTENGVCVYVRDNGSRQIPVNDPDFFEEVEPLFHRLQLNASYEAKVYRDKIEVGCQTFPINILDHLKLLHDKFN